MERKPVYYSEYLQLDKILQAQSPESEKEGIRADDEMLFIIIHQSYELWFKQIMHEVNIVRGIFRADEITDNSNDMMNAVHRLRRIGKILTMLVGKLEILETMTPMDFLDFRDLLRPASGFQSIQFKMLEAALGLQYDQRYGQEYYISQLNNKDIDRVKNAEEEKSLLELVIAWLERMPLFNNPAWKTDLKGSQHPFWQSFRSLYLSTLQQGEEENINRFDELFILEEKLPGRRLSNTANRHALFIMLYHDYPLLQLPYQMIETLLDMDSLLGQWRARHLSMVRRMIGSRMGTGGSSGAGYLKAAADSHFIFKEFGELSSFLIQRQKLPKLTAEVERNLKFYEV